MAGTDKNFPFPAVIFPAAEGAFGVESGESVHFL